MTCDKQRKEDIRTGNIKKKNGYTMLLCIQNEFPTLFECGLVAASAIKIASGVVLQVISMKMRRHGKDIGALGNRVASQSHVFCCTSRNL